MLSSYQRSCLSKLNIVHLFQDSSQIELLKELMDLQKDMVVMMLSLLEGESVLAFQTSQWS